MNIREVSRGDLTLVGIPVVAPFQELGQRVPSAWRELLNQVKDLPHRVDPELFYGVFRDPEPSREGQPALYTYWVTTEVSAREALPPGLSALSVPARRYAVMTCQGGPERIQPAYLALAEWITAKGYRPRPESLGLELYDARRQRLTPPYEAFDFDIYKPLE
jgi:predicted transcriptional regulator YdeE